MTGDRYCLLCRSAWAQGAVELPPVDPDHGLCQRCADGFQAIADRLASTPAGGVHVPGQLQLGDDQ